MCECAGAPATEVAFIDARLTEIDALVAALPAHIEVHILDSTTGGLEQMALELVGRTGLRAIHALSHGAPAMLAIGDILLTPDTRSSSPPLSAMKSFARAFTSH